MPVLLSIGRATAISSITVLGKYEAVENFIKLFVIFVMHKTTINSEGTKTIFSTQINHYSFSSDSKRFHVQRYLLH